MSADNSRSGSFDSSGVNSDGPIAKLFSFLWMILRNTFSMRLQHILTLLTMAIGSFALAATLFISDGAINGLWHDLDRLMGNRVIVYGDPGPNHELLKIRPSEHLTENDLYYVRQNVKHAQYVASRFFGKAQIIHGRKRRQLSVDGIAIEMEDEKVYQPMAGRGFSSEARDGFVHECLVTTSAASYFKLDPNQAPLIGVNTHFFRVVGIVPDPPESDKRFQQRIIVPYSLAQLYWGKPGIISNIIVSWDGPQHMESIINELTTALDHCRAPNAYYLSSSQFKLKKRRGIISNFRTFGSAQSLFCILVAAIGVVNVMLANVVRRMREFAIRVAMGAKQLDIVSMVLTESFMLGFFGASIGITAAIFLSPYLCNLISARIPEASQLVPMINLKGIVVPLLVCSFCGLFAGIIPALRAGRIDILSILRGE